MLQVNAIGKVYQNGTRALENVTLNVDDGEILAVVGGSGCGKSTLLRLISGLDRATTGTVSVDGVTISEPHPYIGLVFQEPRLLPWLNVADNVGFGLHEPDTTQKGQRIGEALEKVGLSHYAARWPKELSGGQAQRVALARALVNRPRVLLLDEPFSALDAFTRAELQDHLLDLWNESRPTLVLVTHDLEEALFLADHVAVMRPHPGRIAQTFDIALPRRRDRSSPEFEATKRDILRSLNATLASHKIAS
ncbi:ABC transporter ATP-binding protein [Phyllobacterium zundukense]|uniref:Nitrate/sulfonate/bicarbonate ABC transporter ATP-binding protein n=1 Tax=Phyllobacterium zundukense TaxID=1867719 RepID=A0A2N9W0J0_9HYPH|nr:ABC transporter ATP-binding protein [Phyllobacterium zundukense]ATU95490.1 nitrate/sulfonate/bicarbonate ABC transporter ATP-binding protein [Phyllobacterium zundukense]PIO45258.1 nitrate/sulfonate/bicarbonate ABC transporter ATP-binding protein [Phyllobacterium zundukense]